MTSNGSTRTAELRAMMTPNGSLDSMARQAQSLTRRHFGKTASLYAPLYLSNHCSGGCAYCGFASDRDQPRSKLTTDELKKEAQALKQSGFDDILLLTGERCPEADFDYLLECVSEAVTHFHNVTVESFAMSSDEYRALAKAGCTGITIYQETYDREVYDELHRWGPKRDFDSRYDAPARALEAGMRTVGMGVLLGLTDPLEDLTALYEHVCSLKSKYWQGGILVSFPRLCVEQGGFAPPSPVDDRQLAQMIFAFRLALPDVPLVLSTRETPSFRDGMAGLGISRMSVASRTTVGGYHEEPNDPSAAQFSVSDQRDVETFCTMLRKKGLEPVFKNWDRVFS